ncbi:ubiquitin-conjugating enzyme/RWD-like protein [Mycena olivaceomarginata]|nr:ubiquitin-conjugating enzyme/RWD-like protein [Mycena olivaceomarginata]
MRAWVRRPRREAEGAYNGEHRCTAQDIVIPESYPFQPVKMKFITKVYHLNASSASGAICLDILKDAWSPVFTLKSTLISLRRFLCGPRAERPAGRRGHEALHDEQAQLRGDGGCIGQRRMRRRRTPCRRRAGWPRRGGWDEVAIAGLEKAHVDQFEALGFPRAKVISSFLKDSLEISSKMFLMGQNGMFEFPEDFRSSQAALPIELSVMVKAFSPLFSEIVRDLQRA